VVEQRAKTVESFSEKLDRPGKSYSDPMKDIPDLCGCRIIVFYIDDIEKISSLIKNEFHIVEEELSHQPNELDADRFGYLSVHYVIKLKRDRYDLSEWKSSKNLHAEIQIRTVIQHAWSAVSHALQYKKEASIPSKLSRRLNRIAGLFELADEEFLGIREQRSALERDVAEKIADGDSEIPLNSTTIEQAIKSWPLLKEATDKAVAAGFHPPEDDAAGNMIVDIYDLCRKSGIKNVSQMISEITPPNYTIYNNIESRKWYANSDFLVFLQLLIKYPKLLDRDDFIRNDWDTDISDELVESARKSII
jgi:putative GTP pyrophosphokinase